MIVQLIYSLSNRARGRVERVGGRGAEIFDRIRRHMRMDDSVARVFGVEFRGSEARADIAGHFESGELGFG